MFTLIIGGILLILALYIFFGPKSEDKIKKEKIKKEKIPPIKKEEKKEEKKETIEEEPKIDISKYLIRTKRRSKI